MLIILGLVYLVAVTIALWFPGIIPGEHQHLFTLFVSVATLYYVEAALHAQKRLAILESEHWKASRSLEECRKFLDTPQYKPVLVDSLREGERWYIWVGVCPRDPFHFFAPNDVTKQHLMHHDDLDRQPTPCDLVLSRDGYEGLHKSSADNNLIVVAFDHIYRNLRTDHKHVSRPHCSLHGP